ncbi:hypothetical protein HWC44_gp106 [Mycobacterium phage ThetaBob]|uniref:Uncharacterized protein n=1 Tax=Mycobacterium phage ThetaBob TaxID=2588513 RepID=A0A4Y6EMR9_9CAUD|nr:hypothetical protein HWC44_gp106 [Mycobacterium phage ThetaBob]QDF19993.1 hypothetical protein SEA_THETABOB_106 [Mycobacterium phage ThetaBob]
MSALRPKMPSPTGLRFGLGLGLMASLAQGYEVVEVVWSAGCPVVDVVGV